jgi:hypothetical protein
MQLELLPQIKENESEVQALFGPQSIGKRERVPPSSPQSTRLENKDQLQ